MATLLMACLAGSQVCSHYHAAVVAQRFAVQTRWALIVATGMGAALYVAKLHRELQEKDLMLKGKDAEFTNQQTQLKEMGNERSGEKKCLADLEDRLKYTDEELRKRNKQVNAERERVAELSNEKTQHEIMLHEKDMIIDAAKMEKETLMEGMKERTDLVRYFQKLCEDLRQDLREKDKRLSDESKRSTERESRFEQVLKDMIAMQYEKEEMTESLTARESGINKLSDEVLERDGKIQALLEAHKKLKGRVTKDKSWIERDRCLNC